MSEIIINVYNEDIQIGVEEVIETVTITINENMTGDVNAINTISKNGVNLPISPLKNVDIEVPTKTSDITNDSGFIDSSALAPYATNEALQSVSDAVTAIEDELPNYQLINEKGANNGYAGLDAGGKVPLANLPSTLLIYKGVWNASTNTPELATPDTDKKGWVYNVSVAGTQFGIDFKLGDWAIFNDNGVIEKSDNSDDVVSVNGQQGVVVLDYEDVGASPVGHNHSGEGINPDYIVLDEQYTDTTMVALPVGALFYNVDQLSWLLKTSANTYLNLGEENTYIAKNGDGVTHLEGQATYVTSGSGNLDVMTLASSANGKIDALATQDVLHTGNGRGMYCFGGKVRTFHYSNVIKSTDNENTWIEGAELYLCSEAGRYSTTKEAAPAKCSVVGKITQRNGANISVSFRPFKAIAFEDLSNVDGTATTLADTDEHLFKDVVTGLWKRITHSNLVTKLATVFGKLSTTNTWALLQTFTSGLKTTKIIPNSDTTGVVIRNAADGADVVKVNTASKFFGVGVEPDCAAHFKDNTGVAGYVSKFERNSVGYGVYMGAGYAQFGTTTNHRLDFFTNGGNAQFTVLVNGNIGTNTTTPETKLDVNGTTTLRDWVYLNTTTAHSGDAIGDRRTNNVSGVVTTERFTGTNATKGSGTKVIESKILADGSHQFGNDTNNTTIEADGTIKLNGAATVWGDIDFPIIIRNTGVGIPTMATFNGNLMMPQWAVNDFNQCESQEFVHEWKEGSTCYFHLHLNTNGLDATDRYVKFEIEYAYSANGVWQFPAVVTTADILIPANTADRTQIIAPLFNFTPTNSKIGDHVLARLKRVASTGLAPTNNPFIPTLQMHVEKDTIGSRNMTTKL